MRLRKIVKPVLDRIFPPLWHWYVRKPRTSRWRNVKVTVPPGVFHPGLFLSSRFLLQHLESHSLSNKTVLEIGSGSGIIAIAAAKRADKVTATDISSLAIAAIEANAKQNNVHMQVVKSDLFVDLPAFPYDFVVVNPPYYPVDPKTEAEHAWFCGAEFEYFQRLFQDLHRYTSPTCQVRMVLSEDCKLDHIQAIGRQCNWEMTVVAQRKRWGEWNYIFSVTRAVN